MGGRNLLLLVGRGGARRDGTVDDLFSFSFLLFSVGSKFLRLVHDFLLFSLLTPMLCVSCFFRVGVERS